MDSKVNVQDTKLIGPPNTEAKAIAIYHAKSKSYINKAEITALKNRNTKVDHSIQYKTVQNYQAIPLVQTFHQ